MNELKIHFLNTIWSDAIILESNNKYAFVDTGSAFYYPMINSHLNNYNIKNIEFILLTHFHSDHYGNIINILNDYNVKELYLKRYYGLDGTTASGYASNEEYIEHELMIYNKIIETANQQGTKIIFVDEMELDTMMLPFDSHNLELYDIDNKLYKLYIDENSPYYMQKPFNENFNSIGTFINVANNHIFLGADVTSSLPNEEKLQNLAVKMINKYYQKYQINHINIYKSCHHGGSGTNTFELCQLLKPNYAVITNTDKWLDNWQTIPNLKKANENVEILKCDYQKYIFTINDAISYQKISEESLFITLNKK